MGKGSFAVSTVLCHQETLWCSDKSGTWTDQALITSECGVHDGLYSLVGAAVTGSTSKSYAPELGRCHYLPLEFNSLPLCLLPTERSNGMWMVLAKKHDNCVEIYFELLTRPISWLFQGLQRIFCSPEKGGNMHENGNNKGKMSLLVEVFDFPLPWYCFGLS